LRKTTGDLAPVRARFLKLLANLSKQGRQDSRTVPTLQ
jgi:hypothetical protein